MSHTARRRSPLSVSSLLYLFSDRVVKQATRWSVVGGQYAVPVPCTATKVQLEHLEYMILAWVLWDLEEKDLVELRPYQAGLTIRRLDIVSTRPGLDGQILGNCTLEWQIVSQIMLAWVGDLRPMPVNTLVVLARREAESHGFLLPADGGRKSIGKGHNLFPAVVGSCQRIEGLLPEFETLLESWRGLGAEKPDFTKALLRASRLALSSVRFDTASATPGLGN